MNTLTAAERLLDDLTVQTQGEAQAWINRLDTMRGQHTVDEARRHVEATVRAFPEKRRENVGRRRALATFSGRGRAG